MAAHRWRRLARAALYSALAEAPAALAHRWRSNYILVIRHWSLIGWSGMRVAAIGDAHLGRSYYPFTTDAGVNQREFDFEQSFEAAVELALSQDPDLILWLGDVFDHPRPSYRSFRVAQRALARIRAHGVRRSSSAATTTRPGCPAPAARTPPWPTASPKCTSPTGWPTSASNYRGWSCTPCPRC